MTKVVRDALHRLHLAEHRLETADTVEQRAECLAAVAEAERLLEIAHRRAEADKIIAKEKAELDLAQTMREGTKG